MKIVSVIGTRPQLVKAAVVTRALRDHGDFDEITIDTGQHYDHEMSELLLADLTDVHRTRDLDLHGGAEHELIARMIASVGDALAQEQPDAVLVYGDTNSTLAGALAATSAGIPLAHVEAGLRSFNRAMREERNRVVADHISDVLLCPTPTAVRNLAAEGVVDGVHHVGDVMYDAALLARARVESESSDLLERLGVEPGGYAVATVHRAETTDDHAALAAVIAYLREVAATQPVVFPVHPRTRREIDAAGLDSAVRDSGLVTCAPVGYFDMTRLVVSSTGVYTDSGGLQKEALFHGVPCVTLRSETEWVETVEAGWNRLWRGPAYLPRRAVTDYGDGHAGAAVARVLAESLERPLGTADAPMAESRARALVVHVHYPETLSYFTDWLDAFRAEPRLDVVPANLATPAGRRRLRRHVGDVDLVVLLHSVVGDSLAEVRRIEPLLHDRRGPLVAFVSNEVSLPTQPIAAKLALLHAIEPDFVGTQLLLESGRYLYEGLPGARVLPTPHALNPAAFRPEVAHEKRPVDIGFRGARYLPHVGDDERNRIIDFFAAAGGSDAAARARLTELTLDVRTNVSYGRKGWSAFLNRCRATIGAESGSVYLTRDDDILSRTESALGVSSRDLRVRARLRPVHRYLPRPVKNALRRGADRLVGRGGEGSTGPAPAPPSAPPGAPSGAIPLGTSVSGKCVSSRHFDAIGTETCQILFPGRYNDLLEPGRHYLRLETDFSNLDDVLDHLADPTARQALVAGAREWALDGHTYAHRVRAVLDAVDAGS